MKGILVVDDQKIVCEGVKKIIQTIIPDIQTIWEANSGLEAYEVACRNNPPIVLVDIMMPGMNGFQLIRRLKREGFTGRFVIISAHEDFNFAKQAIDFKVDDYIIKPVTERKLYHTLSKLLREIDGSSSSSAYRDALLYEYLSGNDIYVQEDVLFMEAGLYEMEKPLWCMGLYEMNDVLSPLQLADCVCMLENTLSSKGVSGIVFHNCGRKIVALLNIDDTKAFKSLNMLEKMAGELSYKCNCGISVLTGDLKQLHQIFEQAEIALKEAQFHGRPCNRYSELAFKCGFTVTKDSCESILLAIQEGSETWLDEAIDNIFADITMNSISLSEAILEFEALIRYLRMNLQIEDISSMSMVEVHKRLLTANSPLLLKSIVKQCIYAMFEIIKGRLSSVHSAIVFAMDYVRQHYNQELSVAYLANLANLNYNYFSSLFTQTTGMTVKEYIMNIRLKNAALLLSDVSFRVKDIAEKCGFENVRYFSICFKKLYGITPHGYQAKKCHELISKSII